VSGKGTQFPMSEGLGGGYPGALNSYVWVHADEKDEARNVDAAFAQSLEDMPGEKESISWGVFPLMGKDGLYVRWNGGGGFGDPLEREPEAVLADCIAGTVSKQTAHDVYGVVLNGDGDALDGPATEARRKALRAARLEAEAAE